MNIVIEKKLEKTQDLTWFDRTYIYRILCWNKIIKYIFIVDRIKKRSRPRNIYLHQLLGNLVSQLGTSLLSVVTFLVSWELWNGWKSILLSSVHPIEAHGFYSKRKEWEETCHPSMKGHALHLHCLYLTTWFKHVRERDGPFASISPGQATTIMMSTNKYLRINTTTVRTELIWKQAPRSNKGGCFSFLEAVM